MVECVSIGAIAMKSMLLSQQTTHRRLSGGRRTTDPNDIGVVNFRFFGHRA
jgi:hypothetical protein